MLRLLTILTSLLVGARSAASRPHIIFILADDMGWNDVSFHGSDQIPTPNIDALAYNGVILNQHYVLPVCTPSRAALMTGKYPIHTGMQGYPILAAEPRGLPEGKLLPEYLKDLGYVTRAVGKWHLGYYRKEFTPTYRGFDSHFGYWTGFVSYYDYILQDKYAEGDFAGFDLRRNLTPAWDQVGKYATDVFTEEAVRLIRAHDATRPLFLFLSHLAPHAGNRGKLLEAPQDVVDKFQHIPDPNRRTYAAMVSKLDDSVGRVVSALQSRDMLFNSIVVFLSDNGAPTVGVFPNWGSNFPHRGVKETLWEGGVRGLGLIWSPMLNQVPRVSQQLMHITDWLPTLYTAAGGISSLLPHDLDGVDQWQSLAYNLLSRRDEVLININEKTRNAAIRMRNWKLVIGTVNDGEFDGYYGDSGTEFRNPPYNVTAVSQSLAGRAVQQALESRYRRPTHEEAFLRLRYAATVRCDLNASVGNPPCNPADTHEPCLYDIVTDPCERNNLANTYASIVTYLRNRLVTHRGGLLKQNNLPVDTVGADPKKWNNTWTTWADCAYISDPVVCATTNDVKTASFGFAE